LGGIDFNAQEQLKLELDLNYLYDCLFTCMTTAVFYRTNHWLKGIVDPQEVKVGMKHLAPKLNWLVLLCKKKSKIHVSFSKIDC